MSNTQNESLLIVDDEPDIRSTLKTILSTRYNVECAADGAEGIAMAIRLKPALILVDIYMPKCDGLSFCQMLRSNPQTKFIPVIIMTALDAKETRIRAFDCGADDFLPKPFQMDELNSRIEAKLRRAREEKLASKADGLSIANLNLDFCAGRATLSGRKLDLGFIEFKILAALLRRHGETVTRKELEEIVWGVDLPATRSLDTHIASLRRKLSQSRFNLKAVYGSGYALEAG